eukprot:scaffold3508_cov149-Skeletonema_menzelii.AAC.6
MLRCENEASSGCCFDVSVVLAPLLMVYVSLLSIIYMALCMQWTFPLIRTYDNFYVGIGTYASCSTGKGAGRCAP